MGPNTAELVLSQAWSALKRHPLVAIGAIANIAISLAIVGGFFVSAYNLEHIASGLVREASISVQLKDKVNHKTVESKLYSDTRVKETKFISKDQALEEYAKSVNLPYKDLKNTITNPLPDMIRVTVTEPQYLTAVAQQAKSITGVSKVRYQKDVAEKLLRVADGIKLLGLVLGGVMVLAALMLVSTTIQLGVHSRRREIRIMQLVGATNNFIRAPFLIEGAVQGLLGGALAAVLLLVGYGYLHGSIADSLTFLELVYTPQFLTVCAAGMVGLGVLFGVIGSLLGTRHYLRLI